MPRAPMAGAHFMNSFSLRAGAALGAVAGDDDEHRPAIVGALLEEAIVDLEQRRPSARVPAPSLNRPAGRLLQLLAVGGRRHADAHLPAGRDQDHFVFRRQRRRETRTTPARMCGERRRRGVAGVEHQRDAHRVLRRPGVRHDARVAALADREIAGGQSLDRPPFASVTLTKICRVCDLACSWTARDRNGDDQRRRGRERQRTRKRRLQNLLHGGQ